MNQIEMGGHIVSIIIFSFSYFFTDVVILEESREKIGIFI